MEKRKKYYHNNREKTIELERNRRDPHKSEIYELKIKNHNLTQATETFKPTISVA